MSGDARFRQQALAILAYMQDNDVELNVSDFGQYTGQDEAMHACAEQLGLSPFVLIRGIQYLSARKLIIPVDTSYISIPKFGRLRGAVRYKVNPEPPEPPAREPKRVRVARTERDATAAQRVATARRQRVKAGAPATPVIPAVRPHIDIDADIQQHVMATLTAIREATYPSNGTWKKVKVLSVQDHIYVKLGVSRSQVARLVDLLRKLNLLIICPANMGGCVHVNAMPEVVTAAMLRAIGCDIEPTVEELKELLAASQRQVAQLAASLAERHPRVELSQDLTARIQYRILASPAH